VQERPRDERGYQRDERGYQRDEREYQQHDERSVPRTIGLTLLGALIPGSGFLMAGRAKLGAFVLVTAAALVGLAAYVGLTQRDQVLKLADPDKLLMATVALVVLGFAWIIVVVASHRSLRPAGLGRGARAACSAFVGLLCFAIAAPLAFAAETAITQRDLVQSVFASGKSKSATRPTVDKDDPWADVARVNVLLLGADDGEGRTGVRTDTVMVASIDTKTGDTALISLPRKLMFMPFPEDSPLHDVYPEGFGKDEISLQDRLEWMLDAMYRNIPEAHPGILGPSDNEGADVLKVSVGEATGLDIDYYAQVNLKGFSSIVDALGGIKVNINYPIPVGGSDDAKVPPVRYLHPGRDQLLQGYDALWFARGRYKIPNPDEARQIRQRCAIHAIAERADPATLLTNYQQLATAGKNLLRTDIPQDLLPAFVALGLKVKSAKVYSVPLDGHALRFAYPHPDYEGLRKVVAAALKPKKPVTKPTAGSSTGSSTQPTRKPPKSPTGKPAATEDLKSTCEYKPQN
jgi:LCP family protein required for cell wall assembly